MLKKRYSISILKKIVLKINVIENNNIINKIFNRFYLIDDLILIIDEEIVPFEPWMVDPITQEGIKITLTGTNWNTDTAILQSHPEVCILQNKIHAFI